MASNRRWRLSGQRVANEEILIGVLRPRRVTVHAIERTQPAEQALDVADARDDLAQGVGVRPVPPEVVLAGRQLILGELEDVRDRAREGVVPEQSTPLEPADDVVRALHDPRRQVAVGVEHAGQFRLHVLHESLYLLESLPASRLARLLTDNLLEHRAQ